MTPELQAETQSLERAWAHHDAAMLRDYLVAGVEDPRINVQSVLSRHFLIRLITGDRHASLMRAEYEFAAVMNWLLREGATMVDSDEPAEVLHALSRGADQCEGRRIPPFLSRIWRELETVSLGSRANYLREALEKLDFSQGPGRLAPIVLNTFQMLWQACLDPDSNPDLRRAPISVFEPACGSANDYRFVQAYGVGRFLDYSGIDLCAANIGNARSMFPAARFDVGNVFALDRGDRAVEASFVHDLFEHLSAPGIEQAVSELCRVTAGAILVGCFNVDNLAQHRIEPYEHYHWNTLSSRSFVESFERHGFNAQVIHIGAFLRESVGCEETHNPNAVTFEFRREAG